LISENWRKLQKLQSEEIESQKFKNKILAIQSSIKWVRISDLTDYSYQLLKNPTPQDIIQGSVGNCYFLSVCSAISYYPHLLEKIFITKIKTFSGIYCLNFFIDGEQKKIVVDDYIPVLSHNNEPVFCKLNQSTKNIWPLILEKAWAKLIGSYEETSGGLPTYPFDVLLGVPCEEVCLFNELNNFRDPEGEEIYITPGIDIEMISQEKNFLIWQKLLSYFNDNYLITCSISNEISELSTLKKEMDDLGLVSYHAYTCIFFQEFIINNDQIVRLVKLRNPWGKLNKNVFKGSLMKNNYYNSHEILLNAQINDKGEFILEFDEFKKFFSNIYISKIKNGYKCYVDLIYESEESINKLESNLHSLIYIIFILIKFIIKSKTLIFSFGIFNKFIEFTFLKLKFS